MKISSKRTVVLGAILGGLLAAGSVAAHATDLSAPAPAAGSLNVASLDSAAPMAAAAATHVTKADGVASGNDVTVGVGPVSPNIPVNVCGVALNAVIAHNAQASCSNSQTARSKGKGHGHGAGSHPGTGGGGAGGDAIVVQSADGLLSGNHIVVAIGPVSPNIPVNICGIAANVLGSAANGTCGNTQVTKSKGTATK